MNNLVDSVDSTSSFMVAVSSGQPISISDDPDAVALIGSCQDAANQINKKEIFWGVSAFYILVNEEVISLSLSMSVPSRTAKSDPTQGRMNLLPAITLYWFSFLLKLELFSTLMSSMYYSEKINRWWKTRSLNQKVKKDEAVSATTKIVCPEANTVSAAPQVKPELPLPVMPTEVEQSILEKPCTDECWWLLRLLTEGSPLILKPSTHMLTAGDANSDLCLYWLGTWQSLDIQLENGEYDTAPSEQGQSPNSGKRYRTFFQGHLGPVHSATLSPLGDFNLSSSAGTTDSPVGHYLASASHDRTARMWSMHGIQPLRIMVGRLSDVDVSSLYINFIVLVVWIGYSKILHEI
ncbi:hypothetical protein DKX38_027749 [Salix brachista]|uniref:Uncharacterized protein n=1 Tax=Salix brachista TaxID=2182728 RepID=A0A5N5J930_9ROSI|nr:hypothetical protein DKX38_027749 [Salix brachista]